MGLNQKFSRLKRIILRCNSCLVAFSGGVDSTFLLKVASLTLPKERILAVTADSLTYPQEELAFSRRLARKLGIRHEVIKTGELKNRRFVSNPLNRCYFCKRELFGRLKRIAAENKLNLVLDASNISDKSDFRPGDKAKREKKVRSPLQEAGFTKEEIRILSRRLGLVTWDKPTSACLASRVPYGAKITPAVLRRIQQAESYLRKIGFKQVRVRHYGQVCRIEVAKSEIPELINKHKQTVDRLKKLGYNYITVDLEGYRTGSMNISVR